MHKTGDKKRASYRGPWGRKPSPLPECSVFVSKIGAWSLYCTYVNRERGWASYRLIRLTSYCGKRTYHLGSNGERMRRNADFDILQDREKKIAATAITTCIADAKQVLESSDALRSA